MAQSGYTPILIYASGTTTNVPSASNLTSGTTGAELALNYYDGKLFYKDASGNVQVLASKAGNINVSSFSAGTTGFTPNTATTGAVTLSGTLATTNGGTGLGGSTPFTANGVVYASSTSALASGSALVFTGTNLGIGTSSPSRQLQVSNSSNAIVSAINTSGPETVINATTTAGNVGTTNSYPLTISTNGTQALYIDTSQNLGLGVTPTSYAGQHSLNVAGNNGLYAITLGTSGGDYGLIGYNVGFTSSTGSYKYQVSDYASFLRFGSGGFQFYTTSTSAPTAGSSISPTQAMTLDNSGNLLVGLTSAPSSYGAGASSVISTGGFWTNRGQVSASASSTTTLTTLANASNNQSYIITVRQSGAGSNSVFAYVMAYGLSTGAVRVAQSNTTGGALDMNITMSGTSIQLVLGSGYGSTTWDWVLTRLG